ncbi:unnamed protein product [Phytophthora lilii]|uniref:Unnamed protein product n=1 Tax=Phytophthora lilii TaxID=2077276 RepID=A0A9W6WUX3_9STRA|nr:unnamed protein product [Phytophthora lilii]
MDKLNKLLDDPDASLDEVLDFMDSYDFNTAAIGVPNAESKKTDTRVDTLGFLCFEDIEDALAPDTSLENKSETQRWESSSNGGAVMDACSARGRNWTAPQYKEHGRVRERVIRLREVVNQLECQLRELNGRCCPALSQSDDKREIESNNENQVGSLNSTDEVGGDVVTWRQIAMRQYEARRQAEKENSSLRERIEEQVRVAKRLERLICGQIPEQVRKIMLKDSCHLFIELT